MADLGCVVCGAFVGHGDACPIRYEELEAQRDALEAQRDALQGALQLMSRHAEKQNLLMPLHEQRQVTEALYWGLGGVCGYCQRFVQNTDPDHRLSPIIKGGRGVECRVRGDYA